MMTQHVTSTRHLTIWFFKLSLLMICMITDNTTHVIGEIEQFSIQISHLVHKFLILKKELGSAKLLQFCTEQCSMGQDDYLDHGDGHYEKKR